MPLHRVSLGRGLLVSLSLVGLTFWACTENRSGGSQERPAPAAATVPPAAPVPSAAPVLDPAPAWPAPGAKLTPRPVVFEPGFGRHRVAIDPGHGNPGNPGNTSCLCVEEHRYNLRLARDLARRLEQTGHFQVMLTRDGTAAPGYRARLRAVTAFSAEALISIHSDVRGEGRPYQPPQGKGCLANFDNPGFAVLWSDEGPAALVAQRRRLARALARNMVASGFLPYDGHDYEDLYLGDDEVPGVFLDRHQPRQRIFFLRRPTMPSVIIETHHAWDPREESRWSGGETWPAFGSAVLAALDRIFPLR